MSDGNLGKLGFCYACIIALWCTIVVNVNVNKQYLISPRANLVTKVTTAAP